MVEHGDTRDLLIEIKTDIKYVRGSIDELKANDVAQAEKIIVVEKIAEKANNSVGLLWGVVLAILGGGGLLGVAIWILNK